MYQIELRLNLKNNQNYAKFCTRFKLDRIRFAHVGRYTVDDLTRHAHGPLSFNPGNFIRQLSVNQLWQRDRDRLRLLTLNRVDLIGEHL